MVVIFKNDTSLIKSCPFSNQVIVFLIAVPDMEPVTNNPYVKAKTEHPHPKVVIPPGLFGNNQVNFWHWLVLIKSWFPLKFIIKIDDHC